MNVIRKNHLSGGIDKIEKDRQPKKLSAVGKNNNMDKLLLNVCGFISCKIAACQLLHYSLGFISNGTMTMTWMVRQMNK